MYEIKVFIGVQLTRSSSRIISAMPGLISMSSFECESACGRPAKKESTTAIKMAKTVKTNSSWSIYSMAFSEWMNVHTTILDWDCVCSFVLNSIGKILLFEYENRNCEFI